LTLVSNRKTIEYVDMEVPGIISTEVESLIRSVERLLLTGRDSEVAVLIEALKQIPGFCDYSVSAHFFRDYDLS
jgi:hypothetical protein